MNSSLFCKTAMAVAVGLLAAAAAHAQEVAAQPQKEDEAAPRAKDDTVRLGTITVVGTCWARA
jgi:iron complex outermembrane receptor protein